MIQAITVKVQTENMEGTKWVLDSLLHFTVSFLYQNKEAFRNEPIINRLITVLSRIQFPKIKWGMHIDQI